MDLPTKRTSVLGPEDENQTSKPEDNARQTTRVMLGHNGFLKQTFAEDKKNF